MDLVRSPEFWPQFYFWLPIGSKSLKLLLAQFPHLSWSDNTLFFPPPIIAMRKKWGLNYNASWEELFPTEGVLVIGHFMSNKWLVHIIWDFSFCIRYHMVKLLTRWKNYLTKILISNASDMWLWCVEERMEKRHCHLSVAQYCLNAFSITRN